MSSMILGNYRWYRRLRGGRWARVTGLLWGKRWVRVTPECVERVDEDYGHSSTGSPPPFRIPFPDEPGFREMIERDYALFLESDPHRSRGKAILLRAEEALRDIRERVEHCGGGPDELNRQINGVLDWYWKGKSTTPSPPAEVAGAGQVGGKGSEVGR